MTTRNVKIVATLGPSSRSKIKINDLADNGVNVFRLNMSHGTHEDIQILYDYIRNLEERKSRPFAILGDLQGPKLRCGVFKNKSENLIEGDRFRFDLDDVPGDSTRVQLPHPEIFKALEIGSVLLVNDGLISLKTIDCGTDYAICQVVVGGTISNRKGVNVPSVILPLSSLSTKDKKDLEFLCTLGVDWIALSFVQRAEDVEEARTYIKGRSKLLSKIEKPSAVENFESILDASDGIMIARGDLGVELPIQQLPPIQKRLIGKCREAGKPVIVATQMLESMVEAPVPTRAEVNDVASAIYDGADAVMLSAESAAGKYPEKAVAMMSDVATEVEADPNYRDIMDATRVIYSGKKRNPLIAAAREIADNGDVKAICCFSQTGATASAQSRERPPVPILALTPDKRVARHLCLHWGVHSMNVEPIDRFRGAVIAAIDGARTLNLANPENLIAVTAGIPVNASGHTNILRIAAMDGSDIHQTEE